MKFTIRLNADEEWLIKVDFLLSYYRCNKQKRRVKKLLSKLRFSYLSPDGGKSVFFHDVSYRKFRKRFYNLPESERLGYDGAEQAYIEAAQLSGYSRKRSSYIENAVISYENRCGWRVADDWNDPCPKSVKDNVEVVCNVESPDDYRDQIVKATNSAFDFKQITRDEYDAIMSALNEIPF